ncbi:MAG: copper resistance protein CopC [Thermomicrobiales bacterium]
MPYSLVRRGPGYLRQRPSMALAATVVLIAFVAFVWQVRFAAGHAEPEVSEPAAGATVATVPPVVVIVFTEEVASQGNRVRVIGPDGNQVDAGDTTVDLNDMSRRRVTVSLVPGAGGNGIYTVEWESVSAADGHGEGGAFTFIVGSAGTPAASPAASPESSPATSPVGSPGASPEASPGAPAG